MLVKQDIVFKLGAALIISGATGNLIDRLYYQAVVDFLDFHHHNYSFPIFNFADSFIFIGSCLLVLHDFLKTPKKKTKRHKKGLYNPKSYY